MNIVPTELNQRLADAVHYSVAAERFYISGKSTFWRLVGLGIFAFGIGVAFGLGCFGYSYILHNTAHIDTITAALSKALEGARLKATAQGVVKLDPQEITLAKGQSVSLDPNSRVLLDPKSRVTADGELRIQIPSATVSPTPSNSQQPASKIPTLTNFTVFKSVAFDKGHVETGWSFIASTQKSPSSQYCYYKEALSSPGDDFSIDIGRNGTLLRAKTLPKEFDLDAAYSNCVWFRNETQ